MDDVTQQFLQTVARPQLFHQKPMAALELRLLRQRSASQVPQGLHFWDKAQHAAGFAGLSFLGLMAYPGRIYALMLGLALFGAGTEVAQWLTGWRFGDWQDWVADCAGIAIGFAGWWVVALAIRMRH
jgi:VanZ family protein